MRRMFAIGDIHGCLTALEKVLEMVKPDSDDTFVFLGDYVDRGPDTSGVLNRLRKLSEETSVIALRGNHDIMFLEARTQDYLYVRQWIGVGGAATMASYENDFANVPLSHWQFLQNTLPYYETEQYIFVHAGVDSETPMTDQSASALYWEKLRNPSPHFSGKTVIVGHTAQKNGVPLDLGHTVCIDTFVYGDGWLSCLNLDTGQIYQANEQGEFRLLWRDELSVV